MDYAQCQTKWMQTLGWSVEQVQQIRSQLPHPKYLDFVSTCLDYAPACNDFRLGSYNAIKDPSWPHCQTVDDLYLLPQHIIDECRYQHHFDFGIYRADHIDQSRWDQFDSGDYPISELLRYKTIVLDVQHLTRDARMVDFACHAGLTSLCHLHAGARSVTGTNVRAPFIQLAEKILDLSGHGAQFQAVHADIHDYDTNTQLCRDADIALLYGIVYHLHDHCAVLDSICSSGIEYIFIDTWIPDSIRCRQEPLISWCHDDATSCWNGWYKDRSVVYSGSPNTAWLTEYLALNDFSLVYLTEYLCHGMHEFQAPRSYRDFLIFRNNKSKQQGELPEW